MKEVFIGIDLGGTNIKFGCFDSDLHMLSNGSVPTKVNIGPEIVIERMGQMIEKLLTKAGANLENIKAIGIGSPGPANYDQGIIIKAANLPEFANIPISKMLSKRLGNKPVILENDANTACFGEYKLGVGKGIKDMVFFTLGTGIGGAIVHDGKLVRGCDHNGAELGHIIIYPDQRQCNCGQKGCVEAYASANSTAKRATEALEAGEKSTLQKTLDKNGQITCKDIYSHLEKGDKLAKKITEKTAEALGILCVNLLHTTEPQRIVFTGGMIAAGDILLDRIKYYFKQHIWSLKAETVEICFAVLGENAGIIGAAALAHNMSEK